jgi:hypothetical protein
MLALIGNEFLVDWGKVLWRICLFTIYSSRRFAILSKDKTIEGVLRSYHLK